MPCLTQKLPHRCEDWRGCSRSTSVKQQSCTTVPWLCWSRWRAAWNPVIWGTCWLSPPQEGKLCAGTHPIWVLWPECHLLPQFLCPPHDLQDLGKSLGFIAHNKCRRAIEMFSDKRVGARLTPDSVVEAMPCKSDGGHRVSSGPAGGGAEQEDPAHH